MLYNVSLVSKPDWKKPNIMIENFVVIVTFLLKLTSTNRPRSILQWQKRLLRLKCEWGPNAEKFMHNKTLCLSPTFFLLQFFLSLSFKPSTALHTSLIEEHSRMRLWFLSLFFRFEVCSIYFGKFGDFFLKKPIWQSVTPK